MNGSIERVNLAGLYTFQAGKYYKVKLTVDNTDCPGSSSFEKNIHITACTGGGSVDFTAQNPFSDHLAIHYTTTERGTLGMNLVNTYTGQVRQLLASTQTEAGDYQLDASVGDLSSGSYAVVVTFNGQTQSKNVIKP